MKFFRSCYRPKGTPAPHQEEANTNAYVSLTLPSSRRNRRTAGPKSASAKHWRPALSMISEDKVDENGERVSGNKFYCKPRSLPNSRSLTYRDEFRNNSMPIFFPAISPTPFMF
ncbi:hypothetical protein I3843_03G159400 [Carya illinoinensis]|uniref:Uncharacterized protein n=1 Tax=Carya illinoinensis TaxID=32201 RepID=A0A8T1R325_CARIL|nr:uncharacterized protein LOC122305666 [Carya illinoinensis]KAG2717111.1 hypothetical protein I3760_03G158000 [Carya illinoinensis]KAG6661306.1 hypothetical protein CIPAW_03G164400 [Carya illinoinensis]KAG6722390.1 hypothetical protein I3842_03G157000 [Carya illinoinensis]KAG7987937.1 hypothetical protein I3843_03G159400 [Carya illinoinensis]